MKKVFIIAEAGVNHNGSVDLAKRLIDVAVDAGDILVQSVISLFLSRFEMFRLAALFF